MATNEEGERLAYRPQEAAAALGIGRTHLYELLRSGAIRSVKSGTATLIPADELRRYLESLREQ